MLAKETENAIHCALPDAVLEHVRGAANDPKAPNKQDILDGAGFALPFARDIIKQVPTLLQRIDALYEQQENLIRVNEQQALEIRRLQQSSKQVQIVQANLDLEQQQPKETDHQPWSQELCRRSFPYPHV